MSNILGRRSRKEWIGRLAYRAYNLHMYVRNKISFLLSILLHCVFYVFYNVLFILLSLLYLIMCISHCKIVRNTITIYLNRMFLSGGVVNTAWKKERVCRILHTFCFSIPHLIKPILTRIRILKKFGLFGVGKPSWPCFYQSTPGLKVRNFSTWIVEDLFRMNNKKWSNYECSKIEINGMKV